MLTTECFWGPGRYLMYVVATIVPSGQHFQSGIAAVSSRMAVQQLDAILAGAALADVLVGADPRRDGCVGFGAWSRKATTKRPSLEDTAICRSPVSPHGVSVGSFHVFPSSRLNNIIRLRPLWVFSRIRQQSSAPSGRPEHAGLARVLAFDSRHHARLRPGLSLRPRWWFAAPPGDSGPCRPTRDGRAQVAAVLEPNDTVKVMTHGSPNGSSSRQVLPPSSLMMPGIFWVSGEHPEAFLALSSTSR